MSLLDVTRELHRTRAEHVRIVLMDFFAGSPPPAEVAAIVADVASLHAAFSQATTAPEEPKNE